MSPHSPIADTYGEAYLSVVLDAALYGITVVQTYMYFDRYPTDRWGIKAFVTYLFLFDSFHQGLLTYAIWHYLIDSVTAPENLLVVHWSLQVYLMVSVIISISVQLFYTYRIWALTRNSIVCAVIVTLTMVYLGFSIYFEREVIRTPLWAALPHKSWITAISLGCNIVVDVLIAVIMTIQLRSRHTDYEQTRTLLNKLVLYAVGTGLLTSIVSILTLMFIAISPASFTAEFLNNMLAKLYTNAVLISLDARKSLRADADASRSVSVPLSDVQRAQGGNQSAHLYFRTTTTSHTDSGLEGGNGRWDQVKSTMDG